MLVQTSHTCELTLSALLQAFWFPDLALLGGLFVAFTGASFLALVVLVKERR